MPVLTADLINYAAQPAEVGAALLRRLPSVSITGLPSSQVREVAERVRSAISTFSTFPRQRVILVVEPGRARSVTWYDLPIAIAVLVEAGEIPAEAVEPYVFAGELSLGGDIRPTRGAIALGRMAKREGKKLITSRDSAVTAAQVHDQCYGFDRLCDVVAFLNKEVPWDASTPAQAPVAEYPDMADMRGATQGVRALTVAAAGGHYVHIQGPPGAGKAMLATRVAGIMPPVEGEDLEDLMEVHDVAGLWTNARVPFRAPHHTCTRQALHGRRTGFPGEVDLALHGVLLLDEADWFQRAAVEGLAERARENSALLVLSTDPSSAAAFRSPLLASCDIALYLPVPDAFGDRPPRSAELREKVIAARARQIARQGELNAVVHAPPELPPEAQQVLMENQSVNEWKRARAARLTWTIADLEGREPIADDAREALTIVS
jgi:magnesium chelatase family protein